MTSNGLVVNPYDVSSGVNANARTCVLKDVAHTLTTEVSTHVMTLQLDGLQAIESQLSVKTFQFDFPSCITINIVPPKLLVLLCI